MPDENISSPPDADGSPGKSGAERRSKRAAAAAAAAVSAVLAVSAVIFAVLHFRADDNSYRIVSPTVYAGQTLLPSDFIEILNESAGCRASSDAGFETAAAGVYMADVLIEGNGGYSRSVECSYTVLPVFRESVTIEAGDAINVRALTLSDVPDEVLSSLGAAIESGLPAAVKPGIYTVTVCAGNAETAVSVTVADTTPPHAEPRTVALTNDSPAPLPSDFVTDVTDATEVTCTFAENYDFETVGAVDVDIILTDEAGNTSSVRSRADCRIDRTPPILTFSGELVTTRGGTVAYRSGVTASDNSSGEVTYTVDADGVDIDTLGDYTVIYTATDEFGNSAVFERTLRVLKRIPPSIDEVMAEAEKIYGKYIATSPDMAKWDIAYAVFRWTHDYMSYIDDGIDKESWLTAAYDGFKTLHGDCFTFMSVSRALLEYAGIPCVTVEHMPRNDHDPFHHWWLLVDIGDGWYHFDSTRRALCPEFEAFMRTDAELSWYGKNYDNGYYVFDDSPGVYPDRSKVSYYGGEDDILTPPSELSPRGRG